MFSNHCRCINCITPPHILKHLLENSDQRIREAALRTLLATARLRGERTVRGLMASAAATPSHGRRTIFNCRRSADLSTAKLARPENGPPSPDGSVNRAFDGLGATRDFYKEIFKRDSLDGRGMRLDGYVHYRTSYNNAFWDGSHMVFGDGDSVLFTDFTKSIDVIAHELTHGVTEFTSALEYKNQSGALNESMSDVFGSLVKQWVNKQTAAQADWLIGAEVFTPAIGADALRSMKEPGSAFKDHPVLGTDPQPDNMDNFVDMSEEDDFGGVHINSGIPNKAFYVTASQIGGFAWEAPGQIWYASLLASTTTTNFQQFADITYLKSGELYGQQSKEQAAVLSAWDEVGIRISGAVTLAGTARRLTTAPFPTAVNGNGRTEDEAVTMMREIDSLAKQLSKLTKEVNTLKKPH